jgi:hypothetical protein
MDSNSTSRALIREIVAHVRCAVCGHHFAASDVRVVGRTEQVWAMHINCRECRTQALLFAVIKEGGAEPIYTDLAPDEWERVKDRPPISTDDVIAVHQYMQSYDGDFSEIMDEPLPEE